MTGKLYIISAASGTGKTSLIDQVLAKRPELTRVITHTTRPMREGEVCGVDYHFVSDEAFEKLLEEDAFVEHAKVYGLHYGTAKSSVDEALSKGDDAIIIVDVQGAESLMKLYRNAVSIFIMPPSLEELERRLRQRNQDDEAVIQHRLHMAEEEFAHRAHFHHVVVNDDFEKALSDLLGVII